METSTKSAIRADNIVKSFGKKKVLGGVSFNVTKGQIFGLLGPSGAGKTTLIKILTGQLTCDCGTALINGVRADKLKSGERKRFGIMMDDFGIYERLSCYENLKIFAEIYGIGKDGIVSALKKVGLDGAEKNVRLKAFKGHARKAEACKSFYDRPRYNLPRRADKRARPRNC